MRSSDITTVPTITTTTTHHSPPHRLQNEERDTTTAPDPADRVHHQSTTTQPSTCNLTAYPPDPPLSPPTGMVQPHINIAHFEHPTICTNHLTNTSDICLYVDR
jgi:hypothetical protein